MRKWKSELLKHRNLEIVRDLDERKNFLLYKSSKVVCLTARTFISLLPEFQKKQFSFDNLIIENADNILNWEIYRSVY